MAAIRPKGERIRQAVKWISDKLKGGEKASLPALVVQASLKFNLSPKEEEYLLSFYSNNLSELDG